MGCSTNNFNNNDNLNKPLQHNQRLSINEQLEPYLQSNQIPDFNFKEINEDIYIGKGLKRMKGYISPISKEELEKKRNAFWGTRTEGNQQTWNFLKELCQMPEGEEENIQAMLLAYDLIPLKGCINITYDSLGGIFEIPNYCINEPYKYEISEAKIEKPNEEKLTFHLRKGTQKTKITCSNYSKILKVKEKFSKRYEVKIEKIRLFFYGKEMKDNFELWNYNVSNNCVVIVMLIP